MDFHLTGGVLCLRCFYLTGLSARHTSVLFLFPDDNLNKYHSIFTELDICIGIMEILFGILTDDSDGVLSFHVFIYLFIYLFILAFWTFFF